MNPRSCDFPGKLLSAYLDDEVSEAERERVERHIAQCTTCRLRLDELRGVSQMLSQIPQETPSSSFRKQLRDSLVDDVSPTRSQSSTKGFLSGLPLGRPALAAVIILLLIVPLAALITGIQMTGRMASDEALLPEAVSPYAEEGEIMTEADEPEEAPDEASEEYIEFAARAEQQTSVAVRATFELEVEDLLAARRDLLQLAAELDLTVHEETLRESVDLQQYLLVLDVPSVSDELRKRIEDLGAFRQYQIQREYHPALPLSIEDVEDVEEVASVSESRLEIIASEPLPPHLDSDSLPGDGFWPMIYSALSSSWHRFGSHVAGAVLWMAAHAVHVLFAVLVVLGAYFVCRMR